MKNTGSELMSEMVGPAGSIRKDGDFSWGAAADEELWREPEELLSEDCPPASWGTRPTVKARGAINRRSCKRNEGNRIKKTLSASLVRRASRVKREVPTQIPYLPPDRDPGEGQHSQTADGLPKETSRFEAAQNQHIFDLGPICRVGWARDNAVVVDRTLAVDIGLDNQRAGTADDVITASRAVEGRKQPRRSRVTQGNVFCRLCTLRLRKHSDEHGNRPQKQHCTGKASPGLQEERPHCVTPCQGQSREGTLVTAGAFAAHGDPNSQQQVLGLSDGSQRGEDRLILP